MGLQIHFRIMMNIPNYDEVYHFDELLLTKISFGGLLNWWINFALVSLTVFGHFLTFLGLIKMPLTDLLKSSKRNINRIDQSKKKATTIR